MFKLLIIFFVSFQLTIGTALLEAGTNQISSQVRTTELINNFMKTSNPSDLPFVDYMENFVHSKTQPLNKFDLSSFNGKQIYIGYGIFDSAQNYCKYIEQPGLNPNDSIDQILTYFNKVTTFNLHSYAVSINKMSFSSCQALTNKFGGYMAVPTTAGENSFLSGRYFNLPKWLGIERSSCLNPYTNQEGQDQEFFNWSSSVSSSLCDLTTLKTVQNASGKWDQANGVESNYCVIEVNSEDINRPLKLCAPWWRIEREYDKTAATDFGGINIYRINQADIPENFNVCTKYNTVDLNTTGTRRATCTTYYDATIAEECLTNPLQSICFVDECSGYIKNACTHIEEVTPFKDYTKTQAVVDGTLQWIKAKDQIRTQVYDCPPALPSKSECLSRTSVIVYPQECPGSTCTALKECLFGATELEAQNKCNADYKCEKIYGSPDSPVYDPSTGEITQLKGICADGTVLSFDVNVQQKVEKKCLEYEKITTTKEVTENCVLNRPFSDYTVNSSLTTADIYQNNPSCIRLNNMMQARPVQEVTFSYINNGYAKTIIKKSFIDDNQSIGVYDGSDDIVISPSAYAAQSTSGTAAVTTSTTASSLSCPSEQFYNNLSTIMSNANVQYIASSAYDGSVPSGKMKIRLTGIASASDCSSLVSTFNGVSSDFPGGGVCNVYYNKSSDDVYQKITRVSDTQTTFISEASMTKTDCKTKASCLGGPYNDTAFGSGTAICEIYADDNYVEPDDPATLTEKTTISECRPTATDGAYASQLNGVQDIFSVQEEVNGAFGYYSNYTTPLYLHNIITVNGLEIYPIINISQVEDDLVVYKGIFRQDSILTKSPNFVAGAVGGSAAYAASSVMAGDMLGAAAMMGPYGLIIVSVIVICTMIFGKKTKLNEQWNYWIIYKMVPVSRYINNVYGYDYRIMKKNQDGTPTNFSGFYKLIYAEYGDDPGTGAQGGSMKSFTGTMKPGDFVTLIKNWFNEKKQLIVCMGWDASNVPQQDVETAIVAPYPTCKALSFSCNKRKSITRNDVKDPFPKQMRNQYIGALNGVTIVVPYDGDYELKAYDQYNNMLSSTIIYEDKFLSAAAGKASYAQVMFGLNMNLATGITDGTTKDACRYDLMVEWGGGVSGIYYENDNTGIYTGCDKSNDNYIMDHSATKITVRSLSENKPFVVQLAKPLPWANRVFLVSLNKKEIRKYRCYSDFGTCSDADFTTGE